MLRLSALRFPIVIVLLALTAVLGIALLPNQAVAQFANAPGEVDAAAIRRAIERGSKYLLTQQNQNGTWGGHENYPGGTTALCVLALINSGVPADDPQIQKSLQKLSEYTIGGDSTIYSSALIVMVFCAVDPIKYRNLILNHAKWIAGKQVKDGNFAGGWSYGRGNVGGHTDNSNSQFAILALHEAERAGILEVDQQMWRRTRQYWESSQNSNGSWSYVNGVIRGHDLPGTGSMTCAGVSSTIIARSKLTDGDASLTGETPKCCQDNKADTVIERGLSWMGKHFSVVQNPSTIPGAGGGWQLYYLYGIERIGRLSGQRFFYGNEAHDWYRDGCEQLLSMQDPLGSGKWDGSGNEGDARVATSLALLFLSKGRRPVVIAKAQWGDNDDWNKHRNDVANLTSYVETAWKKDFPIGLSWQVVNLERASVEDLLQTPVLFISGSRGMIWAAQRAQLLRDYIDRGGFIFAEACCEGPGATGFDTAFRGVVKQMFADKPEHQLKLLDPMHPIWRAERLITPDALRSIYGVDYGCRTCIAYVPPRGPADPLKANLGCWWELDHPKFRHRTVNDVTRRQLEGAFDIGLNVLAYATNRELKSKDENLNLKSGHDKPDTGNRALVYLAKLKHPGGCDTAPGALPGILRAAEDQLKFRVAVEPRLIDIGGKAIFDYHLVFMHGRNSFTLTPNERKQLREYVERGGTIFADSICSSAAFTESFRAEMKQIFPQNALEPIPATDALLTTKYNGFDLSKVTRRQPRGAADGPLDAAKRVGPPDLEAVKLADRYGVIFSKYDLSCALERHDSLECEGYTRDDAERIRLNVLLYSLVK